MVDETDGVGETFDDSMRVALTVASQFGERISRLREQLARQREADARQESRELESRFESERGAMRASLEPVKHAEWWDRANVESIAEVHQTATAWRDHDDVARDAHETIRREVRERYGIDVDRPGADPAALADALGEAEQDRARAAEGRRRAGDELAASDVLLASAESRDRDADAAAQRAWETDNVDDRETAERETALAVDGAGADRSDSNLSYDSSERRQGFARDLVGKADAKTVDARVLADGENAKHPREAVMTTPGKAAKPKSRARSTAQERTRGGLAR
ncbi:hypothetical protein [Microbacterium sp. A1-JK]|uniref:hypothetical protein n=1 Tax=Microbacterium sp. A1-JK TaxID=3177516 RepID=UPI00388768D5